MGPPISPGPIRRSLYKTIQYRNVFRYTPDTANSGVFSGCSEPVESYSIVFFGRYFKMLGVLGGST
jgi:hypothetical protein